MHDYKIHLGKAPDDVLIQYPGKAFVSAQIYPDTRKGYEGKTFLRAEIVYQSGLGFTVLNCDRTCESVGEAHDVVIELAEKSQAPNVYLQKS